MSFGRRPTGRSAPEATGGQAAGSQAVGSQAVGRRPVDGQPIDGQQTDGQQTGKGRPTPKRSDARRRRGGPVAPPPTNRREAAKRRREQQAQQRGSVRVGQARGDEGSMLKRDVGPARRAVRDVVDGRRNIAVLMLPCALLLILASLTKNSGVVAVVSRLWVATLLAVSIDIVLISLAVRRRLRETSDDGRPGGHVLYGLMRATVFRRFRMPPPRVAPPRLFGSR